MNIIIDVGHPADFLLFKEFAFSMQNKGHGIFFTTRAKDVLIELINNLGFEYKCFGRNYSSIAGKICGIIRFDLYLLWISLRFKPDIFLSAGSIYASHVSFIIHKPHVVCEDTGNMEQIKFYKPFASAILTSSSFKKKLGEKQIYYEGYHELAYLHPNYFHPKIEKTLCLRNSTNHRYIILRFVSWGASHDIGFHGMTLAEKKKLVNVLEKYSRVYISSEQSLPEELSNYQIPVLPNDLHHALAFADLVISEGATVAAEAAVLGTPAIYINPQSLGYLEEMERYGLVKNYSHFSEEVINDAYAILSDESQKNIIQQGHNTLLADKIDVTAFLVWFVENFPLSISAIKEKPDIPNQFIYTT